MNPDYSAMVAVWDVEQEEIRSKVINSDDHPSWTWNGSQDIITAAHEAEKEHQATAKPDPNGPIHLRLLAGLENIVGLDISFSKLDPNYAVAALVVVRTSDLQVVHEDYEEMHSDDLSIPYISGYLAFRETSVYIRLLNRFVQCHPDLCVNTSNGVEPYLIMCDGNGRLHPHFAGLACHLGVKTGFVTIGVAKTLLEIKGLRQKEIKKTCAELSQSTEQAERDRVVVLFDESPTASVPGEPLGCALIPEPPGFNPIYVSVGHRVGLSTAVAAVTLSSKHRVPEAIRQADLRGRDRVRQHEKLLGGTNA